MIIERKLEFEREREREREEEIKQIDIKRNFSIDNCEARKRASARRHTNSKKQH